MHFKFVIVLKICNQPLTPNIPTTLGILNQLCHYAFIVFLAIKHADGGQSYT